MADLYGSWGKRARVILLDGKIFTGLVPIYTSAADNDDTEASITIKPESGLLEGNYVELLSSEIEVIEILEY